MQRHHYQRENWEVIDRALFRAKGYPDTPESEFIRWSLWAQGQSTRRLAVISHDSALHYYSLSPAKPAAVHLCVSSRKRQAEHPGCVLHTETLIRTDYENRKGFFLTTPLYTLRTMKPDLLLRAQWNAALRTAQESGLIDAQALQELENAPPASHERNVVMRTLSPKLPAAAPMRNLGAPVLVSRGSDQRKREGFPRYAAHSFTLVEMLVVIAIIGVLAAMLMPALSRARDAAVGASCTNNLKQLALQTQTYADLYNGYAPLDSPGAPGNDALVWQRFMMEMTYNISIDNVSARAPYTKAKTSVITCPGDTSPYVSSVAISYCSMVDICTWYNDSAGSYFAGMVPHRISYFKHPANILLAQDTWGEGTTNGTGGLGSYTRSHLFSSATSWVTARMTAASYGVYQPHSKGFNALFLDWHSEREPYEDLEKDCLDKKFWFPN